MPIDPRDKLDIDTLRENGANDGNQEPLGPRRKFLSVRFRCCNTYARLYMNAPGTHYEGNCPRCGARTRAAIGPGGTDKRLFETS
jgi:hypothetical protein